MAATYVALLRGVNVGHAKRIAMADLRGVFERLGFSAVQTVLNSGNVIFKGPAGRADKEGARIGKAIADELGVVAAVFVLGADELAAALAHNPLAAVAHDASRLLIAVTATPTDRARLGAIAKQDWHPDAAAPAGSVAYLWCPRGVSKSRLFAALNRELGDGVTTRNVTTLEKLLALTRAQG